MDELLFNHITEFEAVDHVQELIDDNQVLIDDGCYFAAWVEPNIVPYSNVILFLKEQTDLLNKFPPDKKQLY